MPIATSTTAADLLFLAGFVGREASGQPIHELIGQARRTLARIEAELSRYGADRSSIRRLRVYVTDVGRWGDVLPILEEWFAGEIPPCVVVEVNALVEPWMQIEIEVDAVTA